MLEGVRIVRRASRRTAIDGGPAAVLYQIEALIEQVCEGLDVRSFAGIAIASAGPLDSVQGVILGIPTIPGWENFPIRSAMEDRYGLPVLLENDAFAATFGEWRHGAGSGLEHMCYLTVSTGIGGGAILDGKLLRGNRGMAAHVGHLKLSQAGPRCACGASGCFEALASGSAFEARARATMGNVDAAQVFQGARAGDPECLSLAEREAKYLGQGITSMIHAFSPEKVIMGGGLSQAFDVLEKGIHRVVQSQAMAPFKGVRVVRAELGDNSGLVGAAALLHERQGV